jgi:folate-dependent phosphoribosylglycinamide formyltransferase PurN
LIFLSAKDFLPQLRSNAKHDPKLLERWRIEYDRQMLKLLRKADSYLNVGYMQIIGPEILRTIDIINLHPAIPAIGPVGMWPGVMKEQAQRPLPYLLKLKEVTKKDISKVMNISRNKAGGMLHIATEELDRGPVISWYEFALTSPKLNKLWLKAVRGYKDKEFNLTINALAEEIRAEQFKGEEPLILLTYKNLTRGDWEIRNKKLYIDGMECQGGYCLNREIGIFLRERGIESLIS